MKPEKWHRSIRRGLAAAFVLLMPLPGAAQWKAWDYELDQEKKPWDELQTQLPAYPKPANLLPFDIGSNATNRYFVDATSVSVGEDNVVRYTLVVRTSGGATNVSFEGIRCEGHQMRIYAFGHPGGQWSRARNSSWRPIERREINGYHYVLLRDHFCWTSSRAHTLPLKDILNNLKNGPRLPTD
jgi:CNP1-like family